MSLSDGSTPLELYQHVDCQRYDELLALSGGLVSARKLLLCVYRYKCVRKLSSHDEAFEQHKRDTIAAANGERRRRRTGRPRPSPPRIASSSLPVELSSPPEAALIAPPLPPAEHASSDTGRAKAMDDLQRQLQLVSDHLLSETKMKESATCLRWTEWQLQSARDQVQLYEEQLRRSTRRLDELLCLFNAQRSCLLTFKRLDWTTPGVRQVVGDGRCLLYSLIIAAENNVSFPHPTMVEAESLRTQMRESLLSWSDDQWASRMPAKCMYTNGDGVPVTLDWYADKFLTANSGHDMHNTAICVWQHMAHPRRAVYILVRDGKTGAESVERFDAPEPLEDAIVLSRTWQHDAGHYEVVVDGSSTVWGKSHPLLQKLDELEAKDGRKLIMHETRHKRKMETHAAALTRHTRRRGTTRDGDNEQAEDRKEMYEELSPFDFLIGKEMWEEEETEKVLELWQKYNPHMRLRSRDQADRLESWLLSLKRRRSGSGDVGQTM